MINKKIIKKIQEIVRKYTKIKLVYFFGSRAKGNFNKDSDYDFAIYIKSKNTKEMGDIKMRLMVQLMKLLPSEKIDIVVLNQDNPTLDFEICRTGIVIYEEEPYRILIESKIISMYFDYYMDLKKYNLTK